MTATFLRKILVILCWSALLLISTYFYLDNVVPYFNGTQLSERAASVKWWRIVHFAGAGCTLFLGPLQFWAFFRNRYRKWHRIAGKVYIGGSIVSALTVFFLLSGYALPGAVPSLGFLAVIWLFTVIAAFRFAVKRNFKQHRLFMIRSYVCALAFVFIRILPYINEYTGLFNFIKDEQMRFTVFEWVCWVYPLMLTEFILVWWPAIKAPGRIIK